MSELVVVLWGVLFSPNAVVRKPEQALRIRFVAAARAFLEHHRLPSSRWPPVPAGGVDEQWMDVLVVRRPHLAPSWSLDDRRFFSGLVSAMVETLATVTPPDDVATLTAHLQSALVNCLIPPDSTIGGVWKPDWAVLEASMVSATDVHLDDRQLVSTLVGTILHDTAVPSPLVAWADDGWPKDVTAVVRAVVHGPVTADKLVIILWGALFGKMPAGGRAATLRSELVDVVTDVLRDRPCPTGIWPAVSPSRVEQWMRRVVETRVPAHRAWDVKDQAFFDGLVKAIARRLRELGHDRRSLTAALESALDTAIVRAMVQPPDVSAKLIVTLWSVLFSDAPAPGEAAELRAPLVDAVRRALPDGCSDVAPWPSPNWPAVAGRTVESWMRTFVAGYDDFGARWGEADRRCFDGLLAKAAETLHRAGHDAATLTERLASIVAARAAADPHGEPGDDELAERWAAIEERVARRDLCALDELGPIRSRLVRRMVTDEIDALIEWAHAAWPTDIATVVRRFVYEPPSRRGLAVALWGILFGGDFLEQHAEGSELAERPTIEGDLRAKFVRAATQVSGDSGPPRRWPDVGRPQIDETWMTLLLQARRSRGRFWSADDRQAFQHLVEVLGWSVGGVRGPAWSLTKSLGLTLNTLVVNRRLLSVAWDAVAAMIDEGLEELGVAREEVEGQLVGWLMAEQRHELVAWALTGWAHELPSVIRSMVYGPRPKDAGVRPYALLQNWLGRHLMGNLGMKLKVDHVLHVRCPNGSVSLVELSLKCPRCSEPPGDRPLGSKCPACKLPYVCTRCGRPFDLAHWQCWCALANPETDASVSPRCRTCGQGFSADGTAPERPGPHALVSRRRMVLSEPFRQYVPPHRLSRGALRWCKARGSRRDRLSLVTRELVTRHPGYRDLLDLLGDDEVDQYRALDLLLTSRPSSGPSRRYGRMVEGLFRHASAAGAGAWSSSDQLQRVLESILRDYDRMRFGILEEHYLPGDRPGPCDVDHLGTRRNKSRVGASVYVKIRLDGGGDPAAVAVKAFVDMWTKRGQRDLVKSALRVWWQGGTSWRPCPEWVSTQLLNLEPAPASPVQRAVAEKLRAIYTTVSSDPRWQAVPGRDAKLDVLRQLCLSPWMTLRWFRVVARVAIVRDCSPEPERPWLAHALAALGGVTPGGPWGLQNYQAVNDWLRLKGKDARSWADVRDQLVARGVSAPEASEMAAYVPAMLDRAEDWLEGPGRGLEEVR